MSQILRCVLTLARTISIADFQWWQWTLSVIHGPTEEMLSGVSSAWIGILIQQWCWCLALCFPPSLWGLCQLTFSGALMLSLEYLPFIVWLQWASCINPTRICKESWQKSELILLRELNAKNLPFHSNPLQFWYLSWANVEVKAVVLLLVLT